MISLLLVSVSTAPFLPEGARQPFMEYLTCLIQPINGRGPEVIPKNRQDRRALGDKLISQCRNVRKNNVKEVIKLSKADPNYRGLKDYKKNTAAFFDGVDCQIRAMIEDAAENNGGSNWQERCYGKSELSNAPNQ